MAAIFGLLGAHDPAAVDIMAGRLMHRGLAYHVESPAPTVTLGAIGSNPQRMFHFAGTSTAVAAGRLYGSQEGGAATPGLELPGLLAQRLQSAGISGLAEIDGDYAAVVCLDSGSSIVLLRDFFGCLPLYWARLDNGSLAFASEYKAIVGLREFTPAVDRDMLQYLQATKRIPSGRTLLANVAAACPGITTIAGNRVASYKPFPPLTCNVSVRDEATARDLIAKAFRRAMRRRSEADSPLGLALSGGIDSIAMAFQLRDLFPDSEIHTFSAGYGDDEPEMEIASEVAAAIGADHHPVYTPASLVETSFRKLVWHMEDPCSRSEALQLMRIGEAAAPCVQMLLSGQGADGLFAGMPRHRLVGMAGRLPVGREALFEIFDLTQAGIPPRSLIGKSLAAALYRGKVPPVPLILEGGSVERPARTAPGADFLNRTLAAGYQNSASQDVAKFERTFGASGVEYASPYLDVAFARMAFTIDERLKIRRGAEKYIFRKAVAALVPEKFRSIPKHPQRMQYDTEFADCLDRMAEAVLSPAAVRSRNFFDQPSIERLRRRAPGRPYAAEAAMRLWTAIATELWAQLFLDNQAPERS